MKWQIAQWTEYCDRLPLTQKQNNAFSSHYPCLSQKLKQRQKCRRMKCEKLQLTSSDSKIWQQIFVWLMAADAVDGALLGLVATGPRRAITTRRSPMSAMYEIVRRAWSIIISLHTLLLLLLLPSVLWRCWLGGRKGIRCVKNWVVGYWRGYLSGATCRLAYGPADATATHCLLLQ